MRKVEVNIKTDKSKTAILFYGKTPIPFSEYTVYTVGTGYIALYEPADNTCVLCRLLDDREVQTFHKTAHRLVLKLSDGGIKEYFTVVVKRDLRDLSEASTFMQQNAI